jgi:uncharacterized membrane protein YphA (DoxX/SURF4 family)
VKSPDRWLALLRILVGLCFLRGAFQKVHWVLLGKFFPMPWVSQRWVHFMPRRVAEFAAHNPLGWYRDFLMGFVIPHGETFASLVAWGELGVGMGLTLGLLTRVSSAVGAFLAVNFLLATFWLGPCETWFHLLLLALMISFLATGAGATLGLDGWFSRRIPRLTLAKRAPSTSR